jgi:hypothetical protein
MGVPTAQLGTRHNPHISRYGNDFRSLYYRRSAVEREFETSRTITRSHRSECAACSESSSTPIL